MKLQNIELVSLEEAKKLIELSHNNCKYCKEVLKEAKKMKRMVIVKNVGVCEYHAIGINGKRD